MSRMNLRKAELVEMLESVENERNELVEMLGAQKDQNSEITEELKAVAENERNARTVIVKLQSKLDAMTENSSDDERTSAIDFLAKATRDPLAIGMKLLCAHARNSLPETVHERSYKEPRAFATQRLLGDLCYSSMFQLNNANNYVADSRAKLEEKRKCLVSGHALDTDDPSSSALDFPLALNRGNEKLAEFWTEFHGTAKKLFLEKTGDVWVKPVKKAKPVRYNAETDKHGADRVDFEVQAQRKAITDLI